MQKGDDGDGRIRSHYPGSEGSHGQAGQASNRLCGHCRVPAVHPDDLYNPQRTGRHQYAQFLRRGSVFPWRCTACRGAGGVQGVYRGHPEKLPEPGRSDCRRGKSGGRPDGCQPGQVVFLCSVFRGGAAVPPCPESFCGMLPAL